MGQLDCLHSLLALSVVGFPLTKSNGIYEAMVNKKARVMRAFVVYGFCLLC